MKYATVLLEHCSKDTTQLFIDYYTGQFRPKKDAVVVVQATQQAQGGISKAASAVQNLASLLPLPYMSTAGAQPPEQNKGSNNITQVVETQSDEPPPKYSIPKPRTAFSAFVDHPQDLVHFLEECVKVEDLSSDDEADLYNTLFELYLHAANGKRDDEREAWESKAKSLIQSRKVRRLGPANRCYH